MRFKKGDKVMGFHQSVAGELLRGDVVKEAIKGEGFANRDRYLLEKGGLLNDNESVKFDSLKFNQAEEFLKRADELKKQVVELERMAREVIYE